MLFGVVFQVCNNLLRLTILVFHLVTFAHLPDSLENDLVVHAQPLLDDEDVVQFVLDIDLALMRHRPKEQAS